MLEPIIIKEDKVIYRKEGKKLRIKGLKETYNEIVLKERNDENIEEAE